MGPAPGFLQPSFQPSNSVAPSSSCPPQHVVHCLPGQVQLLGDQRHLLPLGFPLEDHACHSGRDLVGDAPRPAALVHHRRRTTRLDDRLDLRRLRCLAGGDPFGPDLGLISRHGGKDVRNQTPAGVPRSMPSLSDTKFTFSATSSSNSAVRPLAVQPRRSGRQTTTLLTLPARMSAKRRVMAERSSVVPVKVSVYQRTAWPAACWPLAHVSRLGRCCLPWAWGCWRLRQRIVLTIVTSTRSSRVCKRCWAGQRMPAAFPRSTRASPAAIW